jgi:hypothetical protein
VLVRHPGEAFATIVPEGLRERRDGGTATAAGDRVILAGGGLGPTGPALDSFEVYDQARGAMDRDAAGILASPRRDHGATRLPDGRVLLVGGVAEAGGAPLDSAEIVDPGASTHLVGALPAARRAPAVVTLDDGTVLVLGGYGALGSPYTTPNVFAFDPASEAFETVPDVALPPFARFRAVPLPGARVAFVGDSREGLSSARIHVLRRVPPDDGALRLEVSVVDLGGVIAELTSIDAAATLDGRLVLAGLDPSAAPRAYAIDVGLGQATELPALGAPTHLVALADDVLVALDDAGGALLRSGAATPYANPPATLVEDELAFDAPERWSVAERIRFEALVDDARFDLAPLRFEGFAVDAFVVERGSAELLLTTEGGQVHAVRIRPDTVGLALCETERLPDAPLELEREGDRLTFSAGGASRTCAVGDLVGEVTIAVRASAGAVVRAPSVRRVGRR